MRMYRLLKRFSIYDGTIVVCAVIVVLSTLFEWPIYILDGRAELWKFSDLSADFYMVLVALSAGMVAGVLMGLKRGTCRELARPAVAVLALVLLMLVFQSHMYYGRDTMWTYIRLRHHLGRWGLLAFVIAAFVLNELLCFRLLRKAGKVFRVINTCIAPVPTALVILCLWPSGTGRVLAFLGSAHAARAGLLSLFHPWRLPEVDKHPAAPVHR